MDLCYWLKTWARVTPQYIKGHCVIIFQYSGMMTPMVNYREIIQVYNNCCNMIHVHALCTV